MTEHVPTTEGILEVYLQDLLRSEQEPARAEFERWLASVKAATLREAAEALRAVDAASDAVFWDGDGYEMVTYWLNNRADEPRIFTHSQN